MRARRATIAAIVILTAVVLFFLVKLSDFLGAIYTPQTPNQSIFSLPIKREKTSFNVVLLGYGGGAHAGGLLTDSIMVVHVNTKDKLVILISIPRDLWVSLPLSRNRDVPGKINTAYAIGVSDKTYPNKAEEFTGEVGGGNMAKYAVEQVTGLAIDYYAALNFRGFVEVIDTLGGVEVELELPLDDYEYPIEGREEDLCGKTEEELPDLEKLATISAVEAFPCRYEHVHFDAGRINLDGEQALKLVRSRHSVQDGDDFARSARQQRLILAVKDQVLSLGFIPKLIPLMDSLSGNLTTDMPYEVMKKLLGEQDRADEYEVRNVVLSDKNLLKNSVSSDGQYILIPTDGAGLFARLHAWIAVVTTPSKKTVWPTIAIENGTYVEGLGKRAFDSLAGRGLQVAGPTTAPLQGQSRTIIKIYDPDVSEGIVDELRREFGTGPPVVVSDKTDAIADIVVTIGDDYARHSGI